MKKVLVIAYSFPPAGEVGIYRTLKFLKYLPEFGWRGAVLATKNGRFQRYDESMLALVPEAVSVDRCHSLECFNEGQHRGNVNRTRTRTLWTRLHTRLYLLWHAVATPDTRVGWVPFALWKALQVVRRDKIEHVYVSGSPFSAFLVGVFMKMFVDVRVVIDYRDPWTQNINYYRRARLQQWFDRRLEAWIVSRSDAIIGNTRHNNQRMMEEFGAGQSTEKFVAIHNGFDAQDFDRSRVGQDKFTITYAGAFYFSVGSDFSKGPGDAVMETYSPLYFFSALQKLLARRADIRERIQVNFMGVLGHGYDPIIRERGLEGVISRIGYVGYEEHIDVLRNADALLLVLSRGEKSRGWIPSKFYQYLGSGNPILALVPEGEVRDIIHAARAGVCMEPDDVDGAARAIEALFDAWAGGQVWEGRNEVEVAKYERRHLTGLLAKVLEGA